MIQMKKTIPLVFLTAACMLGCAKKPVIKTAEVVPPTPVEESPQQEDIEASLRGKEFSTINEMAVIRFDYDRSEIRSDMTEAAAKNAEFLKAHPDIEVRIDGHCDNRGTTEYNLGLGQRRAMAIRAYYKSLGVAATRMATQSWGEEKPLCGEETEACHTQNRRVETMVRVKAAPTPAPGSSKEPPKTQIPNKR